MYELVQGGVSPLKSKMNEDNSNPVPEKTSENTQKSNEEQLYPDRILDFLRLPPLARAAGITDHKFISSFRTSSYHFQTVLSNQQEKVLSPTRNELLVHIKSQAPGYCFPAVLLNAKDQIKSVEELRGEQAEGGDDDTVHLEFKNSISGEDVIDHNLGHDDDSEEEDRGQEDDEDMAADYAADYADQDMESEPDDDDDEGSV